MIVADTNVVSELVRPDPNRRVVEWLDGMAGDVVITAITEAELRVGVSMLPLGQRRRLLQERVETLLAEIFDESILPFDGAAAVEFAVIVSARRLIGRPVEWPDAQIAAIARSHGCVLATRNTADFEESGVALLNPWEG
jgi:predicted nucleic acid-binding protein